MLNKNESETGIDWEIANEFRERLNASGGSANSDDGKVVGGRGGGRNFANGFELFGWLRWLGFFHGSPSWRRISAKGPFSRGVGHAEGT